MCSRDPPFSFMREWNGTLILIDVFIHPASTSSHSLGSSSNLFSPRHLFIVDQGVAEISSVLNSDEVRISTNRLKLAWDFWVPWFQYQSPRINELWLGYGWKDGTVELEAESTRARGSSSSEPSWRSSNVSHWSGSWTGFCVERYVLRSPKIFLDVLKICGVWVSAVEYPR